jgi:cell division protein FtsW
MKPRSSRNPRTRSTLSMLSESRQRRHRPDYILLLLASVLLVIGLVVLYAISPGLAAQQHVSDNYYVGKQLLAILMGLVAFTALANVPLELWQKAEKPLIITAGIAAVAVRLFGQRVNGAYRWIQVGGMSFQAAELVKFALLIWLAGFFVQRMREGTLGDFKKTLQPLLIALALLALVVGKVQSDLGSTAVMVGMVAGMAFIIGMPLKRVAMVGGVVTIGVLLLVATSSYRRQRLLTFMHPEKNCQTTSYQVCQALISVGSGGVVGLGLGNSVQAYGYLPEAANDSIFAILAEKFGFIGVTALIALFVAFFSRLFKIAEDAPDDYSRLLVVGVIAWLGTQALINMGAMLGLLPLKGITLPLISYGGTSLIFIMGALGLVFQVSRYTTYKREGGQHENSTDRRGNRRPHHAATSRRPEA